MFRPVVVFIFCRRVFIVKRKRGTKTKANDKIRSISRFIFITLNIIKLSIIIDRQKREKKKEMITKHGQIKNLA